MEQPNQQSTQPPVFNPQGQAQPPAPQYQPRVMASPMMSPIESVVTCFKKCFVFKGRARRSEFWWLILLYLIVNSFFTWLGGMIPVMGTIGTICSILLLIPQFAAATRRMHDTGHSGWWIFAIFIFFLGYLGSLIAIFAPLGSSMLDITDNAEIVRVAVDSIQSAPSLATIMGGCSLFALILLVITLVFAVMDSAWDANKYGPSPKYS